MTMISAERRAEPRSALTLSELGLVDAPADGDLDSLTALARDVIDAPVALVSIIDTDADRQFFKSQQGLSAPWAEARQTPLSHSFCRHVVWRDAPLMVVDTMENALVQRNPAIEALGVAAYLGAPVRRENGEPIGALCVIDHAPRAWDGEDVARLERLAACVSDAIKLRESRLGAERRAEEQRDLARALGRDLSAPIDALGLIVNRVARLLTEIERDGAIDEARALLKCGGDAVIGAGAMVDGARALADLADAPPRLRQVDLEAAAASVAAELRDEIDAACAHVDIRPLPTVLGDEDQLKTLLRNLVSNAVKHRREEAAPEIVVSARRVGAFHEVSVRDNGVGVDPAHQERVFEMFERLGAAVDRPGAGLGLAICRRVVGNHKGEIELRSTPGEGSEFRARLPIAP